MEPITLAVVTSSVVTLALKVIEGTASEAGKSLWSKLQKLLGFEESPSTEDLGRQVAMRLKDNKDLSSLVLKAIKAESNESASKLVDCVDADKVVIIGKQNIEGDFTIKM